MPMTPSPQNILEHLQLTKSNSMIIIPTLLQIWSNIPDAVKVLSSLVYIGYSGGSLAPKLGNHLIDTGVHIHAIYGGTEFGAPSFTMSRVGEEREWEYMRFSDRVKIRWVPQGDGTFECQFLVRYVLDPFFSIMIFDFSSTRMLKSSVPQAWEKHSPMVLNLPDAEGYATADLWAPHPTKKDLWKIVGRVDDVIVHSSGEKTVPAPMEDIIMSSPL
ncbi:hypothetical protein C0995_002487, partial [Termitomyces sp. Mi166